MSALLTLLLAALPAQGRPRVSTPARQAAPERRTAKAYADEGRAAYARGDYLAAAAAWEAAYTLRPVPGLLFNRAQALRMAGSLRDSLDTYRRFLTVLPTAAARDNLPPEGEVRRRMAELEQLLAPPPVPEESAQPPEAPAAVPAAAPVVKPEPAVTTDPLVASAPIVATTPIIVPTPIVAAEPIASSPATSAAPAESTPALREDPSTTRPAVVPSIRVTELPSPPALEERPGAAETTSPELRTLRVTDRRVLRVEPVATTAPATTPSDVAVAPGPAPSSASVAAPPSFAASLSVTRSLTPAREAPWLTPTLWTTAAVVALGGGVLWMLSENQAADAIRTERSRLELDQQLGAASALRTSGLWLGVAAGMLAVTAAITLSF